VVEAISTESHGAQGHMGAVHGLDGEAIGGAVDVGIGDEL
jgi:hypothetical protein